MDSRELDLYDFDAVAYVYATIRQTQTDVVAIAFYTGMRVSWIARIKAHLFYRTHRLARIIHESQTRPWDSLHNAL